MTKQQAEQWVRNTSDEDADETTIEQAWLAIMGREPDDEDREQGLWSHLCQVVE